VSARRADAISLLERSHAFPKALRLHEQWSRLDDHELITLVALRYNMNLPEPRAVQVRKAVAYVRDALAQKDHPLRLLPVEVLRSHCDYLLEKCPDDVAVQLCITALLADRQAEQALKAEASAKARPGSSASAKVRRTAADERARPYIQLWMSILRDGRFVRDSEKATNDAQAAEFNRRVVRERLETLTGRQRGLYKSLARAELSKLS
jgi:hypothetical protein